MINDLTFIEAVMDSTSIIDYINTPKVLLFSSCFVGIVSFLLILYHIIYLTLPYLVFKVLTYLFPICIVVSCMYIVINKFNNISRIDEVLTKVEQDHPEVYGQDEANYVRALYLKCYAENNDSCSTIKSFVNGYMIENWEQPIKLKIIKN